jgi:hypothetical protein
MQNTAFIIGILAIFGLIAWAAWRELKNPPATPFLAHSEDHHFLDAGDYPHIDLHEFGDSPSSENRR